MPRDLALVAFSLFTWGIGEGMFIYFQPLTLQKWGANPVEIGVILSGVGIGMAVAQAPAGYLADRVGARPVMWSAWVLGFLATGLMAVARSLPIFAAGLILYAITAFVNAPMYSYIIAMRDGWSVERSITIVTAMMHLGSMAGPILGGMIADAAGLQAVYPIAAGIFFLSTAIVFLIRQPPAQVHHAALVRPSHLLTNPRFMGLLVMIFLTMFTLYLPQPLNAIYLQNERHLSIKTIGILGSVASLSNALVMLAFGGLRAPVALIAGQGLVAMFSLLMWRGTSQPEFIIGFLFLGGYRLCRSMNIAYARSMIHSEAVGLAFGLVETVSSVSVILAPLLAGFLYARNPQSVYIVSLGAIGVMMLVHFLIMSVTRRPVRNAAPADPE
ncbi:MAG TPA: MFS transporter [Anaerolineaceae bacterium]